MTEKTKEQRGPVIYRREADERAMAWTMRTNSMERHVDEEHR